MIKRVFEAVDKVDVDLRGATMFVLCLRDPVAGNIQSGQWKKVHHLRRTHCYWFVVRNSLRCETKHGEA